jgi:hydroxymethylpyrimidine/phosphomethylpyrimidine kinase
MMRKNNTSVNTMSQEKYMSQKSNTLRETACSRDYVYALTIAGSDSGGGAGIQADLKAFAAAGVFGLSALTAITAQNSREVSAVMPVGTDMIRAQIKALREDFDIGALKTGMLVDARTVRAVTQEIASMSVPVVVDPVMIASSGAHLLNGDAIAQYRALIQRAALLTPNLPEAQALLGGNVIETRAHMRAAANALLTWGCNAVLLKGGHARGARCFDLLLWRHLDEVKEKWFTTTRLNLRGHGTGCTLAALCTAYLAQNLSVEVAVARAIRQLRRALSSSSPIGAGAVHTPDPLAGRYVRARHRD